MAEYVGIGAKAVDWLRGRQQAERRVRVLVHRGYFDGNPDPFHFVKVSNLSPSREIEITHVWWDLVPRVDVLLSERPLPTRLRIDETWEGWTAEPDLSSAQDVSRLARVLVTGRRKPIRSRLNQDVPPRGFVAAGGSP